MNTEYIIYTLYIIPLLLSLQSYQYTARVYERLPDKLPMNFDFHGEVNSWWSKNWFSAYLMPMIGLLTTLMMCGILFFIHNDTGPLPDDFALIFWLFTFSLVYLFYKAQEKILGYSLDSHNRSWPVLNKAFFLLAFACVGLISLMFINTTPELSKAVFCTNLENKQAVDVREHFSLRDERIYLLLHMHNIKGEQHIRTEWFNPKGSLYFKYRHITHHKVLAKRQTLWSYINLNNNGKPAMPGQWHANIYINGDKVQTKEFTITR